MRCRIDWSKNAAQARELSVQRDEWFDDEEIKGKDCSFRALTAALPLQVFERCMRPNRMRWFTTYSRNIFINKRMQRGERQRRLHHARLCMIERNNPLRCAVCCGNSEDFGPDSALDASRLVSLGVIKPISK